MIEIKNSLLTGTIQLDSDKDGNVILLQNKQEIKLTPSQVLDVKECLCCILDKLELNNVKGADDDDTESINSFRNYCTNYLW